MLGHNTIEAIERELLKSFPSIRCLTKIDIEIKEKMKNGK